MIAVFPNFNHFSRLHPLVYFAMFKSFGHTHQQGIALCNAGEADR